MHILAFENAYHSRRWNISKNGYICPWPINLNNFRNNLMNVDHESVYDIWFVSHPKYMDVAIWPERIQSHNWSQTEKAELSGETCKSCGPRQMIHSPPRIKAMIHSQGIWGNTLRSKTRHTKHHTAIIYSSTGHSWKWYALELCRRKNILILPGSPKAIGITIFSLHTAAMVVTKLSKRSFTLRTGTEAISYPNLFFHVIYYNVNYRTGYAMNLFFQLDFFFQWKTRFLRFCKTINIPHPKVRFHAIPITPIHISCPQKTSEA